MKSFLSFISESKNTHLEHLEDAIFLSGVKGIDLAVSVVNDVIKTLRGDAKGGAFVSVKWDGAPVGIDKRGSKKITIPSKNEFVVLDVEVNHAPEQFVEVHFSDPLSSEQFLDGLVHLESHDVTIVADGQLVMIFPNERIIGDEYVYVESGIKNTNGKSIPVETAGSFLTLWKIPNINIHG